MREWDWYKRRGFERWRRYVSVIIIFIYSFLFSYIIF